MFDDDFVIDSHVINSIAVRPIKCGSPHVLCILIRSFLPTGTCDGGDDENVFPHLIRVSENEYNGFDDNEQWADGVHKDRFDVSKLAQWEKILQYADQKGMYLHFKTMEQENCQFMDGNRNGRERKLYYRELIARFGHHLALNWNISEETRISDNVTVDITKYLNAVDPYNHNIVIHTFIGQKDDRYGPLLGDDSELTGASIQSDREDIHDDIVEWIENSKNAGKKWVVANDEQGHAGVGIQISDELIRHEVLYATLMAGGAGVEYYYGSGGTGDLDNENHRDRGVAYEEAGYAVKFFQEYFQNYLIGAESNDGLTGDSDVPLERINLVPNPLSVSPDSDFGFTETFILAADSDAGVI